MSVNAYGSNDHTGVNDLSAYGFEKKFNGHPILNFVRVFVMPFMNACAQVSHDGSTLKEHILETDPGGRYGYIIRQGLPLGVYKGVPQIHANDAQTRSWNTRSLRLYGSLMYHIDNKSYIYMEIEENCMNNGLAALEYLKQMGELVLDDAMRIKMERVWDELSLASAKISIGRELVAKWFDVVMMASVDFVPEKTYAECRIKFLNGLPSQMSDIVSLEMLQPNPAYNFPAFYPQFHINAGMQHPFAGQCDIRKMMVAFQSQWFRKIDTGAVTLRNDAFVGEEVDGEGFWAHDTLEEANFGKGKGGKGKGRGGGRGQGGRGGRNYGNMQNFTVTTRCYNCGGLGHVAVFYRNGERVACPTIVQIPRETLNAITYPHIDNTGGNQRANAVDETDVTGPAEEANAVWWD